MNRSYPILILISIIAIMIAGTAYAAAQITSPTVDREASEEAFLRAYGHFINNRMWDCIDELNASLAANIYFVDAYYMRSLAYRRLGRYPEAISEMTYYMEVRQEDPRAGTILRTIEAEWGEIRRALEPGGMPLNYRYTSDTIHSFFGVPITSMISLRWMHGLGKMAYDGSSIILCDTFGDKVWLFESAAQSSPITMEVSAPVVSVPLSPVSSMIFGKSGDISLMTVDRRSVSADIESMGAISADVIDAALIDSSLLAVADRLGGLVRFISLVDMSETLVWAPSDSKTSAKLFEPVSLASYGSYLAVADRGNERVFVLDGHDLSVRARFDVPAPRDLQWGLGGELFILSENGTLYTHRIFPSASGESAVSIEGLKDAWCFVMTEDGPVICDIVGRTWWGSKMDPGHTETVGLLSLHSPWLEDRLDTETLMVRAQASSVFQHFIQNKAPETQTIWRGESRPSQVIEMTTPAGEAARIYSPAPERARADSKIIKAESIKAVIDDISQLSRKGEAVPKVIVLDTAISASKDDLALFTAFLMQQGIRADLWAVSRPPSVEVQIVSQLTSGHVYYARDLRGVPQNTNCEWVLSIPLPPDTYTFGYPSESTLSVYAGVDVVNFTDWLPIWPALLKK